MLTKTEVENIIKQVNNSFNEDRKRIEKLEAKIVEIEKKINKPISKKDEA